MSAGNDSRNMETRRGDAMHEYESAVKHTPGDWEDPAVGTFKPTPPPWHWEKHINGWNLKSRTHIVLSVAGDGERLYCLKHIDSGTVLVDVNPDAPDMLAIASAPALLEEVERLRDALRALVAANTYLMSDSRGLQGLFGVSGFTSWESMLDEYPDLLRDDLEAARALLAPLPEQEGGGV